MISSLTALLCLIAVAHGSSIVYEKVADKSECDGKEKNKGHIGSLKECAELCTGYQMFIYGTNDFGGWRCSYLLGGCQCRCQIETKNHKCVKQIRHNGYRLYRYVKPKPVTTPRATEVPTSRPEKVTTPRADQTCNQPLGMKDGRILDSQITTRSSTLSGFPASHARLDNETGCCMKYEGYLKPRIEIDFKKTVKLTGIQIQGVKKGKFSNYVSVFHLYYFGKVPGRPTFLRGNLPGAPDATGTRNFVNLSHHDLSTTKIILQPTSWKPTGKIACLRLELFGCEAKPTLPPTTVGPTTEPAPRSCDVNNGGCDHTCHDNNGTISCSCKDGYELLGDGMTCKDINECRKGTDDCHQYCNNTQGSYHCSCKPGFVLQPDKKSCKDIDECQVERQCHPPKPCNLIKHRTCTNKPGTFECGCEKGYEFEEGWWDCSDSCIDIDECKRNNGGCSQKCHNNEGSFKCSCRAGYKLASNGRYCEDVNECNTNNGGCDQNCYNYFGSYKCSCREGYRLDADKHTCNDIDECKEDTDGCSHGCNNTIGSYQCTCPSGLKMGSDKLRCQDVDECALGLDDCEQICVNRFGYFECACRAGYKLDSNGKNCSDVNECAANPGPCEHTCENNVGSFDCKCRKGFQLMKNKRSCEDVDECATNTHTCDTKITECVNTHGSFECRCKDGFERRTIGGKCERIKCVALQPPADGRVEPYLCSIQQGMEFEDKCKFKCDDGYKLNSVSASEAQCNKDGHWSLFPKGKYSPMCERLNCKKLSPVENGDIVPSSCKTDGAKFEESCNVFCSSGYDLVGDARVTCLRTGDYDRRFGNRDGLICVKRATIQCPKDFSAVLPEGQSTMTLPVDIVTLGLKSGNKVTSQPEGVLDGKYKFKVGRNVVTYTATNEAGKTAKCVFHVNIIDKEPPKVKDCAVKDIYVDIKAQVGVVNWKVPTFTDNVRVAKRINNMEPGRALPQQVYFVFYVANDEQGNSAVCRFFVHVRAKYCDVNKMPGGDGANKSPFPMGNTLNVFMQCPPNTAFSSNNTKFSYRCTNGVWMDKSIPDCVPYVDQNGTCASGSVPIARPYSTNVCAECPRGTYQEGYQCIKCPVGKYQEKTGSVSCNECPDNKITSQEGARSKDSCYAKCDEGQFSSSGLSDSKCQRCPKGSFNTLKGQNSCSLCPLGGDSEEGSSNEDACKLRARIEQVTPENGVSALFNSTVTVECKATGSPFPNLSFERVDGKASSRMSVERVATGNKYINAVKMVIENATPEDEGQYRCVATNMYEGLQVRDERDVLVMVKDA